MAALATVADLEALLGRTLSTAEATHATTLLDSASEAVRVAAGQQFSRATTTVRLATPDTSRLGLPQRPIVSVDAVTVDGNPDTGWAFVGGELVRPGGWRHGAEVAVTYTHGYLTVPRPVRDLVCHVAAAALVTTPGGLLGNPRGIQQEQFGGNMVTYSVEDGGYVFELPERTVRWLRTTYGNSDAGMVPLR